MEEGNWLSPSMVAWIKVDTRVWIKVDTREKLRVCCEKKKYYYMKGKEIVTRLEHSMERRGITCFGNLTTIY
jgi:RecA-family ATPase